MYVCSCALGLSCDDPADVPLPAAPGAALSTITAVIPTDHRPPASLTVVRPRARAWQLDAGHTRVWRPATPRRSCICADVGQRADRMIGAGTGTPSRTAPEPSVHREVMLRASGPVLALHAEQGEICRSYRSTSSIASGSRTVRRPGGRCSDRSGLGARRR